MLNVCVFIPVHKLHVLVSGLTDRIAASSYTFGLIVLRVHQHEPHSTAGWVMLNWRLLEELHISGYPYLTKVDSNQRSYSMDLSLFQMKTKTSKLPVRRISYGSIGFQYFKILLRYA